MGTSLGFLGIISLEETVGRENLEKFWQVYGEMVLLQEDETY